MRKKMKIIAGLGNPGTHYQNNRHNIGFMILDHFASLRKMSFKSDRGIHIARRNTFSLVKPQSYMNLSGDSLSNLWRGTEDELLVICDDIYLPFGEIRLRMSGGDGGHNGLKSIILAFGTDQFYRMRIGVGLPEESNKLKHHVLEDFTIEEQSKFSILLEFSSKLIDCFTFGGFQSMTNHNSKNKQSYSEKMFQNQCPKEDK
jgi:PTH1 family peptidyl-tRNA hydrolase